MALFVGVESCGLSRVCFSFNFSHFRCWDWSPQNRKADIERKSFHREELKGWWGRRERAKFGGEGGSLWKRRGKGRGGRVCRGDFWRRVGCAGWGLPPPPEYARPRAEAQHGKAGEQPRWEYTATQGYREGHILLKTLNSRVKTFGPLCIMCIIMFIRYTTPMLRWIRRIRYKQLNQKSLVQFPLSCISCVKVKEFYPLMLVEFIHLC